MTADSRLRKLLPTKNVVFGIASRGPSNRVGDQDAGPFQIFTGPSFRPSFEGGIDRQSLVNQGQRGSRFAVGAGVTLANCQWLYRRRSRFPFSRSLYLVTFRREWSTRNRSSEARLATPRYLRGCVQVRFLRFHAKPPPRDQSRRGVFLLPCD